jgi:PAS domain S-box-containing protein
MNFDKLISENVSKINLKVILNKKTIQKSFENFFQLYPYPLSIIDIDGNLLISLGWQTICTKFHRLNKESCKKCILNDITFIKSISEDGFKIYKCLNNLYEVVAPIIINNIHIGNLFIGQFLLDTNSINDNVYRKQAEIYGYNINDYILALKQIKIIDENSIKNIMLFFIEFTSMLIKEEINKILISNLFVDSNNLINKLKASEEKYRLIVENQTDLIVKTNLNGNILYASPSYCKFFGLKDEDIFGKPYSPLIYEDDLPIVEKAIKAMLKPPYRCHYEERVKTKDGWKWIQWKGQAIIGINSEIDSLIGTGRDITEQKKIEEKLFDEKVKQEAMVPNILDVLMVVDKNLIIKYVSDNIENIFGWTSHDLCGQKAFGRIYTDDIKKINEIVQNLINKNEFSKTSEFRYINKNGSISNVEVTFVNLLHNTHINSLLVNYHDISDIKKSENEIIYLSYKDVLTGLYNRTYFEKEIKHLENLNEIPLSVIMGDVNGLKVINDGFGHIEGDNLLKQIANILSNSCRKDDIICRIGGDEFCVLLPKTDGNEVQSVCNGINQNCIEINKNY